MSILYYYEGDHQGRILTELRRRLPGHQIIDWNAREQCDLHEITAAIAWMPPDDFFAGLKALKHLYALSAGVDYLLQHPGLPDDVTIIRLRDAGMARQMAEYALYGTLHAQRRMGRLKQAQERHEWVRDVQSTATADTRIGVLGAGALGLHVATSLSLIGYPVSCWSRSARQSPDGKVTMLQGPEALPTFLSRTQVLVCLLPLTDATRGILNRDLFAQLPEGAFLINPGRGDHLVEDDLLEALESGRLGGALLDVFSTEPLPAAHPFWDHPDIVITPHVAAQTQEEESVNQIVESIGTVERGGVPAGTVDRQRGY